MSNSVKPIITGRVSYSGELSGRIVLTLTSFTNPLSEAAAVVELRSPGEYAFGSVPSGIYYLSGFMLDNSGIGESNDSKHAVVKPAERKLAQGFFGPNRPIVITEKACFEDIDFEFQDM